MTPDDDASPLLTWTEEGEPRSGRFGDVCVFRCFSGFEPSGTHSCNADGAFELRVPNEHLQIVCSQVATLTGGTVPRQPRARREWLADAWRIMG